MRRIKAMPPDPHGAPGAGQHTSAGALTWAAAALIVGAVLLRFALADYPFWFDEYATLVFAREPLSHLWGPWMVRETNPPLFYTLAKGWHAVAGDSFAALRLLPIFGSACSMVLLGVVADRAYGPRAVLPALLLYALSTSAIFISHQFRGYIFCEVGVLLALVGLVDILRERGPALRSHGLFVAGSALAIYSHTTMLLWPVIATVTTLGWFALFRRESLWRATVRLLAADLCLLVLSAWLLWLAVQQLQAGAPNVRWMKSLDLRSFSLLLTQNSLLVFYPSIGYLPAPGIQLGKRVIELALALAALRTLRHPPTQLFAALFAAGAALFWVVQRVQPVATDRTVHWLSVFVVLIIAGGLAQIRAPLLRLIALSLPAAALTANLVGQHDKLVIAHFPGPIAGHDPARTVVLTEHRSDALVFLQACRMYYRQPDCPVQLIPLDSRKTADSWADGMFDQPLVGAAAAQAMLPADKAVFTFRHGTRDPLIALGLVHQTAPGREPIEGPFSAAQMQGREPLPPGF